MKITFFQSNKTNWTKLQVELSDAISKYLACGKDHSDKDRTIKERPGTLEVSEKFDFQLHFNEKNFNILTASDLKSLKQNYVKWCLDKSLFVEATMVKIIYEDGDILNLPPDDFEDFISECKDAFDQQITKTCTNKF